VKGITVLFENEDCLVLNKPAGLPVQGGRGIAVSLDSLLGEARSPRPLLVHRLDRDTSGVILVAKRREAAARFAAIFSRREEGGAAVQKQYLAVCAGRPKEDSGTITLDLEIRGERKPALTRYALRSAGEEFSLLELELGTGRMHQIRRHLAAQGLPILGDDKYGDFALNRELRKQRALKRLLLHASRLRIPAALLGYPLDVSAPLPDYFLPFTSGGGKGYD
jgi:23S rRNA pseudouridine955/2504/2580 synthase